jgi:single-strand DNA-binding protein
MLNRVTLIGNLGKDPELRETQSGHSVVNFRLATTERVGQGEDAKEVTEWHSVVAWDGTAKAVHKALKKGSRCFVEGRLRTREWEDRDGNKQRTTEVMAQRILFLDRKAKDEEGQAGGSKPAARPREDATPPDDESFPF